MMIRTTGLVIATLILITIGGLCADGQITGHDMTTIDHAMAFLCLIVVFVLPGLLLARATLPDARPEESLALTLGIATFILPHLSLAGAMLLGTTLSAGFIILIGCSACIASVLVRGRGVVPSVGHLRDLLSTPLTPVCIVVMIAAAAMSGGHPLQAEGAYVLEIEGGISRHRQAPDGCEPLAHPSLPENLVVHVERLGGPAILGAYHAVAGDAGLALAFGLAYAACLASMYAAGRTLSIRPMIALATSLLVLTSPLVVRGFDEARTMHLMSAPAASLVLFLVIRARTVPMLVLTGMAFGSLGGVMHITVLMAPALALAVASSRHPTRAALALLSGLALTALPWALWHRYAYGAILVHETQPPLGQLLLGGEDAASFNGMLNSLRDPVRTPGFPLPSFLYLPFSFLGTLGVLLSSATILGLVHLPSRPRAILLLWLVPFLLFLGLNENWDGTKTYLSLPAFIVLALPAGYYLDDLLSTVPTFPRRAAVFIGLITALLLLPRVLPVPAYPLDPRWALRFPGEPIPTDDIQFTREELFSPGLLPDTRLLPSGGLTRDRKPLVPVHRMHFTALGDDGFIDPCDPGLRCYWVAFRTIIDPSSWIDSPCHAVAFTSRFNMTHSHVCVLERRMEGCPGGGAMEDTLASQGYVRDPVV